MQGMQNKCMMKILKKNYNYLNYNYFIVTIFKNKYDCTKKKEEENLNK